MLRRRHEQQAVAIDARLGREGEPEKQHDEEIADRAHGAQHQFQALAEDRAAAGRDACRRWEACGRRRRSGRRGIVRRRRQAAEIEEAGVDAVPFQERLDVDELRFDACCSARSSAGRWWCRRGRRCPTTCPPAPGRRWSSRSACGSRTTRPSRLLMALSATPSSTPAKIRNSVAANYQVNSEQGGEQHDADAADRYRPRQIVAGLKAIVSRTCHVDSFSQNVAEPVFGQNATGIKRARTRRFDAGASGVPSGASNLIGGR